MYVSVTEWRDLTDGHPYREGDRFPFDGREVPQERLDELEDGTNRAGLVLIRKVESPAEDPKKDPKEEPEEPKVPEDSEGDPEEPEEKPKAKPAKKPAKSRK